MNETFFISTYVLLLMRCRHEKNVPSLVLPLLKLLTHSYHLYSFETDQINKGFSIQSQEKIHFSFDQAKRGMFIEGSNEVNLKFEIICYTIEIISFLVIAKISNSKLN